jgi:hypothetical protein
VSGALADAVQVFGAADPTFKRNAFLDHRFGLLVQEADATLEGDLIANNASTGFGIDCDAGTCIASASNVTFFGNGQDVFVDDTQLTLDSSIVGDPISADQSTCAIAYSRGPTTTSGGDGCQAFQTTADPAFVNPAGDDFHLQPGSPMIDAGNPVAPVPGVIDRDGDPRALDGNCDGPAIRDIGYDEVVADCTPPSPGPDPGSGDTNPPDTTITEKPKDKTKSKTATFAFISSEAGSTFDCSLDGKATFKPCTSPLKVKVKKGKHSFAVQATDAAGNTDPTPATDSWKVKKKKKKK